MFFSNRHPTNSKLAQTLEDFFSEAFIGIVMFSLRFNLIKDSLTLTMLCLVDSKAIRLWILANALLTYVYSVHLKPLTGAP